MIEESTENFNIKKCLNCQKKFKSSKTLKRHVKEFHTERKKFQCLECKTEYKRKSQLVRHLRCKHVDIKIECPFCIKYFQSKKSLNFHIQNEHKFDVCRTCNNWTFNIQEHFCELEKRFFQCSLKGCEKRKTRFQKMSGFLGHLTKDHKIFEIDKLKRIRASSAKKKGDSIWNSSVSSEFSNDGFKEKETPQTKASLSEVFQDGEEDDEEYVTQLDNLYILCSIQKNISLDDLRKNGFKIKKVVQSSSKIIRRTNSKPGLMSKRIKKRKNYNNSIKRNMNLIRSAKNCLEKKTKIFKIFRKQRKIFPKEFLGKYKYFQDTVRMNMINEIMKDKLDTYKTDFIKKEKSSLKSVSFFVEKEHKYKCSICYPKKNFENVNFF